MNDLISRQAAIEAICKHGTELERRGITVLSVANHKQATVDLLESLQPAQPEPKWIPCESEPPNKYGNYLITTDEGEVDIGTYSPDRPGAWSACDAKGFHWVWDVVAWMPLPKPYERSEE